MWVPFVRPVNVHVHAPLLFAIDSHFFTLLSHTIICAFGSVVPAVVKLVVVTVGVTPEAGVVTVGLAGAIVSIVITSVSLGPLRLPAMSITSIVAV